MEYPFYTRMIRSLRCDVRNPLLALPSALLIADLPEEARAALGAVLREISLDARQRAEKCWRTHKAPMAAYWKAVAVYAGHAQRLTKAGRFSQAVRERRQRPGAQMDTGVAK